MGQKSEAGVEVPVEPVSDDHFSLDFNIFRVSWLVLIQHDAHFVGEIV